MLNNSFTKTNTIFGQALGCTALDDAFVKLLSDVNADGVTQFLVRTNGEEKMFQICFVQYIQNILSKPASILPFDAWRRCANCRQ